MKERKRHQELCARPSAKRRRLILKQERSVSQGAQEAAEGVSYQSGIGLQSDVDVEIIPDAVPRGDFKPIKLHNPPTIIVMDLETTDLIRHGQVPHTTQIAAEVVGKNFKFNQYVMPNVPISPGAQQTTGIHVVNDKMFIGGREVAATEIHTAVDKFLEWLTKFDTVVLVAHNGKRFDFPVLVSTLTKLKKLDGLLSAVVAFLDSFHLFRKLYPNRTTYKQEALAFDILNLSYAAHDAAADVLALSKLIQHAIETKNQKDFDEHLFLPKAVHFNNTSLKEKSKNIDSLNVLVYSGVCKRATAENIASSGLNLEHLKKIYSREGEDGLFNIFTVKNTEGQPRVTNTKRTLESVIPKLVDYLKSVNEK